MRREVITPRSYGPLVGLVVLSCGLAVLWTLAIVVVVTKLLEVS